MLAVVTASLLGTLCLLVGAQTAYAEPDPGIDLGDPPDLSTEVTIAGLGAGTALGGFDAPAGFDPLGGYPAAVPPGSTAHSVSFAGLINIEDPVSGRTGLAYCIDLFTDTGSGVHYQIGDWTEANVSNLGYVGYVLANYFPLTDEPSAAPDDAQRAAAVQAAIWFFSDSYVLPPTSPVYGLVAGIVADALLNGPATEPGPPQLGVTPSFLPAPDTGEIVGPFEVTGDGPATIRSVGVEVFTDPEGTDLLADGAEVQPGASLWARSVSSDLPQGFVLEREVDVLQSSVFLYDGSNPGREDAQKLVLAQPTELIKRAGALLAPFQAGSLLVTKTIDGSGAGLQDDVEITITCTDPDGDLDQEFVVTVPAGTAAGDHPEEVGGILVGSECVVTETSDGDNDAVNLVSSGIAPDTVTIADDETALVSVTNTYELAVGALAVTKTIEGAGAGEQDEITLSLDCDVDSFDQEFVIGARTGDGTYAQPVVTGIPAGTTCTVTETSDGENGLVELTSVVIEPAAVTIDDGTTSDVVVTDTYAPRTGGGDTPGGDDGPGGGDADGTGDGSLAATGPSGTLEIAVIAFGLLLSGSLILVARSRSGSL
jgi:hypothetical protein